MLKCFKPAAPVKPTSNCMHQRNKTKKKIVLCNSISLLAIRERLSQFHKNSWYLDIILQNVQQFNLCTPPIIKLGCLWLWGTPHHNLDQFSYLAPKLGGIKQKKYISHCWGSGWFLVEPAFSQVTLKNKHKFRLFRLLNRFLLPEGNKYSATRSPWVQLRIFSGIQLIPHWKKNKKN